MESKGAGENLGINYENPPLYPYQSIVFLISLQIELFLVQARKHPLIFPANLRENTRDQNLPLDKIRRLFIFTPPGGFPMGS